MTQFIFDLDGTLFDTKGTNYRAYMQAIHDCGFEVIMDYAFYCSFCNGNYYKDFLPRIITDVTEREMEYIHERKKRLYKEYLFLTQKNDHLFTFMRLLHSEYMISLVTTASRKNVNEILDFFCEKEEFDFIISQEDVEHKKPSPECFIKAMDIAGVNKKNTIIFEDSEAGLQAAKESGANYVKVYGYS